MPCYHPLDAWYDAYGEPSETGKKSIVFRPSPFHPDLPPDLQLPCGRCLGCCLERSRQWAMRCVHESSLYDSNCFITLTFNPGSVKDGSLHKNDFKKFIKRFRKNIGPVRYFHCGEYGSKFSRPHHHACLFGYDFPDKVFLTAEHGHFLYRSAILDGLWKVDGKSLGFAAVGSVTFESAAYVARYVMKKIDGKKTMSWYAERGLVPEYNTMSRKPPIAQAWIDKYGEEVLRHDSVVMNGFEMKPARFYDRMFDLRFPERFAKVKAEREERAKADSENSRERLLVREAVKASRVRTLRRSV